MRRTETAFFEGDRAAKSQPHGTQVWLEEEQAVRAKLGNDAYIAAVQLYADATAVTLKGRTVHPVYIALLNRPYNKKILRTLNTKDTGQHSRN